MNFFTTIPWYVVVIVFPLVMATLLHIYKKPKEEEPDKPEVMPDDGDPIDLEDMVGRTEVIFSDRVNLLFREFLEKKHSASMLFDLLVLACLRDASTNQTYRMTDPLWFVRLRFMSHMLLDNLNDFQLQEISLRLIKFCEEELNIVGLNDEAFRHRSQVNQSTRLLEMARAILTFLLSLNRTTVPSNFVRHFNHAVVQTLYADAMAKVVKAKKSNYHVLKNKFHQHNREQRAKRLQRQARNRAKND